MTAKKIENAGRREWERRRIAGGATSVSTAYADGILADHVAAADPHGVYLLEADAPELIRDTIGTALVAGANITITINDGADTITIASTGGGGGGGTAPFSPSTRFEFYEDYVVEDDLILYRLVGTGTVVEAPAEANHPGIYQCSSAASASTSTGWLFEASPGTNTGHAILLDTNTAVFEALVRIPTLLAGGNTGQLRLGFMDEITGAPSNGVHAQYDDTTANWRLFNRNAGVSANVTGGTAVAAGTWTHIRITATSSISELFVNGVSQGTLNTQLPVVPMSWGHQVQKTALTTALTQDVDLTHVYINFNTPRYTGADPAAFLTLADLVPYLTVATAATTYQPLDATLTALAAYNTNGLLTQTAADTFTGRTITGTANEITVANGSGVAGNPTLSLPTALTFTGKTVTGGTFNVALGAVAAPTYSFAGDTNTGMWSPGADTLAFSTAGGQEVTIDPSGRLLLNRTASVAGTGTADSLLQIGVVGAAASLGFHRYQANAFGPFMDLCKSRAATVDTHTVVNSTDNLAGYFGGGSDGSAFIRAGGLTINAAGAVAAGIVPGEVEIETATTAGVLQVGLRVRPDQVVEIPLSHNPTAATGTTPLIASGTYTPTLTNGTNVAASTTAAAQWMRVGNVVHVSGSMSIDPTAASATTIVDISLPIASNFAATTNCNGTGSSITTAAESWGIYGSVANDRAVMQAFATNAANHSVIYHFQYEVL